MNRLRGKSNPKKVERSVIARKFPISPAICARMVSVADADLANASPQVRQAAIRSLVAMEGINLADEKLQLEREQIARIERLEEELGLVPPALPGDPAPPALPDGTGEAASGNPPEGEVENVG